MEKFTQVTEFEKKRAIGALAGSPMIIRKAIKSSEGFHDPLPFPNPEDWLASNYEAGQTYDQFTHYANIPDPKNNKFYIQPFDTKLSSNFLKSVISYASAFFPGIKLIVCKKHDISELGIDSRELSPGVYQYNASQLLKKIYKIAPVNRFAIIGVTCEDIYNQEEWNFVFGLASPMSKAGVFSFARYFQEFYSLPPDNELVILRAAKVMVHEMCHMFGLLHCIYYRCLMNGSNHIGETDSKPLYLCPVCLRKLHLCLKFNPVQRFSSLSQVCTQLGGYFTEFADRFARRAASIEKSKS